MDRCCWVWPQHSQPGGDTRACVRLLLILNIHGLDVRWSDEHDSPSSAFPFSSPDVTESVKDRRARVKLNLLLTVSFTTSLF